MIKLTTCHQNLWMRSNIPEPPKPKQVLFFFLPQKFCGNSAKLLRKSFVISLGVQGCLLFCISAMILVALQNNSLIDVLCIKTFAEKTKLAWVLDSGFGGGGWVKETNPTLLLRGEG